MEAENAALSENGQPANHGTEVENTDNKKTKSEHA
jgi:hypothetical protein